MTSLDELLDTAAGLQADIADTRSQVDGSFDPLARALADRGLDVLVERVRGIQESALDLLAP